MTPKPFAERSINGRNSGTLPRARLGQTRCPLPRLRRKVEPSYTEGATNAGAQGTAILEVAIWPDGKAHDIQILRRLPYGLTWKAVAAVRKWRFKPGEKLGEPVKVTATIEVNFRLR